MAWLVLYCGLARRRLEAICVSPPATQDTHGDRRDGLGTANSCLLSLLGRCSHRGLDTPLCSTAGARSGLRICSFLPLMTQVLSSRPPGPESRSTNRDWHSRRSPRAPPSQAIRARRCPVRRLASMWKCSTQDGHAWGVRAPTHARPSLVAICGGPGQRRRLAYWSARLSPSTACWEGISRATGPLFSPPFLLFFSFLLRIPHMPRILSSQNEAAAAPGTRIRRVKCTSATNTAPQPNHSDFPLAANSEADP